MQQKITLRLLPSEATNDHLLKEKIADTTGKTVPEITGYHLLKRSLDARSKTIYYNLTLQVFINEPFKPREKATFRFNDVSQSRFQAIIIGAGPCGLFAALKCIENGIRPVILERGKDVKARRRDLARLNKEGIVDPDSNYCFGEGGAGTYSDGKLYTRSNKRGDINRILSLFVHFGAGENILYDAHPHIGTNKLPHIITAMRERITACGGEVHFNQKVIGFSTENNRISSVKTADGSAFRGDAYLLATGHSARDIFRLLKDMGLIIEAKSFALGVRAEHPQSLVDSIQYHCPVRSDLLPPASYSLVEQINDTGVFSFCMCPGGIIAPASTDPGELVVNGWSPSKRNNPFANSGIVVQVTKENAISFLNDKHINPEDPLLFMYFQQLVEQNAFEAGGGKFVAPAQRMVDFSTGNHSPSLPDCSYNPGIKSHNLDEVLPPFIYKTLAKGFAAFGKKMKGYYTNEAVIVATESRTSSPVRIPRNNNTLAHPQLENFYPCGEGAGYAGGIVSAAMDGERVADQITKVLLHL